MLYKSNKLTTINTFCDSQKKREWYSKIICSSIRNICWLIINGHAYNKMDNNSQILSKKINPYAKCICIEGKNMLTMTMHKKNHYSTAKIDIRDQSYFHHINDCIQLRSLIWNKDLFKNNRTKEFCFFNILYNHWEIRFKTFMVL